MRDTFELSERRACGLIGMAVSTYRYRGMEADGGLREKLIELARAKPRYGYRRLHVLLWRDGEWVNHKRVWRVYREAGLSVKRRKRKRLQRVGRPLEAVTQSNEEWAIDFASDALAAGRPIRVLSVVDAFTRECLALEADTSFASRRVTRVLDRAIQKHGGPRRIRLDNGPELTSRHFLAWAIERRIELLHIQPGRPMQNGRVESFHGKLRDECLNVSWFRNLFDARRKIGAWRREYNEERPHSSLNYLTPAAFARAAASPFNLEITAPGAGRQGNPAGSLRSALTPGPTPRFGTSNQGEAAGLSGVSLASRSMRI
jgi:putative transposase